MTIPTEPIGSIPRPRARIEAIAQRDGTEPSPSPFFEAAILSPIDPRLETPEELRDRILEAVGYIPAEPLGTTDDCGFSPSCDDISTTRDAAFAKIRARVEGTDLASALLVGGG